MYPPANDKRTHFFLESLDSFIQPNLYLRMVHTPIYKNVFCLLSHGWVDPFCPSETPILLFEVLLSLAGGVDALGCIAAHDETLTIQKQAQRSFP